MLGGGSQFARAGTTANVLEMDNPRGRVHLGQIQGENYPIPKPRMSLCCPDPSNCTLKSRQPKIVLQRRGKGLRNGKRDRNLRQRSERSPTTLVLPTVAKLRVVLKWSVAPSTKLTFYAHAGTRRPIEWWQIKH